MREGGREEGKGEMKRSEREVVEDGRGKRQGGWREGDRDENEEQLKNTTI